MIDFLKKQLFTVHQNGKQQVSDVFKYIGPGIIVTVGFIDPGNWASNIAAGSGYGYELLWMVTLSTIMLIFLQASLGLQCVIFRNVTPCPTVLWRDFLQILEQKNLHTYVAYYIFK